MHHPIAAPRPLVLNSKSFLIPPFHHRSLWSEIVTEVVPVIGSIEWLCHSVLRRAEFSTRHALQAVRNIHQHTPFHWWWDESPHTSIRKESMYAPVLVEQEGKSPTVCMQVLAYIRQLSQGWMRHQLQASITWLLDAVILHKIGGKAVEQRYTSIIASSAELGELAPLILKRLGETRDGTTMR